MCPDDPLSGNSPIASVFAPIGETVSDLVIGRTRTTELHCLCCNNPQKECDGEKVMTRILDMPHTH
jgi:hypothetical protein